MARYLRQLSFLIQLHPCRVFFHNLRFPRETLVTCPHIIQSWKRRKRINYDDDDDDGDD